MNINSIFKFRLDALSGFVLIAVGLFSVLTILYSLRFMRGRKYLVKYYIYLIFTIIAATVVVLANSLILLLTAWGFLGLALFLLINIEQGASAAAKKTMVIVGGSDALMLFGIALIYYLGGTFQMDKISLSLADSFWPTAIAAYLCLAVASFAKAGAMPFHSWVPECAEYAPVPVVAFLPASLDKLLGIYLLARASLYLFTLGPLLHIFLMLVGAITIICAVMMALVQHNMKRLLGYHAVSQVGYMVLGIGTGNPLGIAGGLFHMLNNAVYKSCLFFGAGNVEYRNKTTDLDKLGGLMKVMPITYVCFLIASLSISGVPPFNGFMSKWLVYQGVIENFRVASLWMRLCAILCLIAAMFGSALTLASFVKILHAVFLGPTRQPLDPSTGKPIKEVSWTMWLPMVTLAFICVVFGIFANQIPLRYFIFPVVGSVPFIGEWYAGLSSILVIAGLLIGLLVLKFKVIKIHTRQDASFIGAETKVFRQEEAKVSGTDFYNTIKEVGVLGWAFRKAQAGVFDIYQQGKKISVFSNFVKFLHNGVLPTYLVWVLLGMLFLFLAIH